MIDIELTGFTALVIAARKINELPTEFMEPIQETVDEVFVERIKERLRTDPRPPWKDHLFTQSLYNATESKAGKDYVDFGYFVDYGMHIEPKPRRKRIGPHDVSFATLKRWVAFRFGLSGEELEKVTLRIYRRITSYGNRAYPIILPVVSEHRREFAGVFADKVKPLIRRIFKS